MAQPIADVAYWNTRTDLALERKPDHPWHAFFICNEGDWKATLKSWRRILSIHIKPEDSILDAGCAMGFLLDVLPKDYRGEYLGLDFCPKLLAYAREKHPENQFIEGNLLDMPELPLQKYDWAVIGNVKPMVLRELGEEVWEKMLANVSKCASKVLILEYDPAHKGEVL